MVQGGEAGTATLNLGAGKFVLVDAVALFGGGGKPATAELEVTEGDSGDLPDTPATVVAEETGEDEYAWEISGLKTGENEITFDSEGEDAIHVIIAVPLEGKVPPLSTIKKDLGTAERGPPPAYINFLKAQNTAVLDGGKSHDQEGLLSVREVKG